MVTGADAIMLVAPEELILAASKVTEATPLASVNFVVWLNTIRLLVAANVTTVFGTAAPLESFSVAVAVTGVPYVAMLDETFSLMAGRVTFIVALALLPPDTDAVIKSVVEAQ